jgi:putative ABC transport system permease protein
MGKFGFLNHFHHPQAASAAGTVETKPILSLLEQRMEKRGIVVVQNEDSAGFRKVLEEHLKIIAVFLIMMSLLTIVIGGLGLASSMSVYVIERMREIGVMRSIGGTNKAIINLFIKEGVITGLISWVVSIVLSMPLTHMIGASFGNIFFQAPLDLNFGHHGIIAWLVLMTLITVTASFFPARKATQLAVREVLSYE